MIALEQLLQSTAAGDRQAFAQLYSETSAKLFGIAIRMLRRSDWAEEVVQDAYVKVWQRAGDYRPDRGSPLAWMATIVRNRALDVLRRKGETAVDDVAGSEHWADDAPDPLHQAEASADLRALLHCLGELPEQQRDCIVMAFYQGYTHEELARRLDSPVGTIKSWVRRGLIRIRSCLER